MNLPIQSEPVERMLATQPSANYRQSGDIGARDGSNGQGIQPSGLFDDILGAVRTVGQVASTAGPILGSLGI
jgi:hypothetical protein